MPYKRKRVPAKRRTYTKKRLYPKRRSLTAPVVKKMIKRMTLKTSESKFKCISFGKTEMNHNSFNVYHMLNGNSAVPAQGVRDDQRIGDQVNVSGFKLRILYGQKGDRPNVNFRWFVLKVPKGSGIVYANWFITITGSVLLDDPNTDFVKVLKTGIMRPNQAGLTATGDDEFTFARKLWIPYKKLLKFGPADSAVTHNDDDIYFVAFAYDAYGTLISDTIAYCQVASCMYYRDP